MRGPRRAPATLDARLRGQDEMGSGAPILEAMTVMQRFPFAGMTVGEVREWRLCKGLRKRASIAPCAE